MSNAINVFPGTGILGLLKLFPHTSSTITAMLETVLRGDESVLSRADRELIFTVASWTNGATWDGEVHGAIAATLLPNGADTMTLLKSGPRYLEQAIPDEKIRSLCMIAGIVASFYGEGLRDVMQAPDEGLIAGARTIGCTDAQIHEAVIISSLACMLNRYNDALSEKPEESGDTFKALANEIIADGYLNLVPENRN